MTTTQTPGPLDYERWAEMLREIGRGVAAAVDQTDQPIAASYVVTLVWWLEQAAEMARYRQRRREADHA